MAEPGKSWRSSPEQTREQVLEGGVQLLSREGLALGADRISLERAAAQARVPRATAYRIWKDLPIKPQEAFQIDLLCHVAETQVGGSDAEIGETADAIFAVLEATGPPTELTHEKRAEALVRVVKAGAAQNLYILRTSPGWQVYAGIVASASSRLNANDETMANPPELIEALERGAQIAAERYAPLYQGLAEMFGMRLRSGYTMEQFATIAGCLVEGLALRLPFSPHISGVQGPYPGIEEWDLFGVGFLGLLREFFEADPDVAHPTVLNHEPSLASDE